MHVSGEVQYHTQLVVDSTTVRVLDNDNSTINSLNNTQHNECSQYTIEAIFLRRPISNKTSMLTRACVTQPSHKRSGAKTITKNTNSTQNKSQTHRSKQYEVTSFLSTDAS